MSKLTLAQKQADKVQNNINARLSQHKENQRYALQVYGEYLTANSKQEQTLDLMNEFEAFLNDREAAAGYEAWLDSVSSVQPRMSPEQEELAMREENAEMGRRLVGVLSPGELVIGVRRYANDTRISVQTAEADGTEHELILTAGFELVRVVY